MSGSTPSTSLSCEWTEALIEAYALLKSQPRGKRVLVIAYDQALPKLYADAHDFPAYALSTIVSLEQPNLEIVALSGSDSMESLDFYAFWQSTQLNQVTPRWKGRVKLEVRHKPPN